MPDDITFKPVFMSGQGMGGAVTTDEAAAADKFAKVLYANFKAFCPVNKNPHAKNRGALKASIVRTKVRTPLSVAYEFSALDYIWPVIDGSRPHRIPKIGGAPFVAFPWDVTMPGHGPFSLHEFGSPIPRAPKLRMQKRTFKFGSYGAAARGASDFPRSEFHHNRPPGEGTGVRATMAVFPYVNHPGTKPNDFVEKALEASEPAAEEMWLAYGDQLDVEIEQMTYQALKRL